MPIPTDRPGYLFGGCAIWPSLSSLAGKVARSWYRNDFHHSSCVKGQLVQDLEVFTVYKAEETMQWVDECLRVTEETRQTTCRTLVTVHQQGQQIRRTHAMALDIDQVIKIIFLLAEPHNLL
jgi:synaptosomal-associated protein 25